MQNIETIDLTKIKFTSYCWSVGTTSFRTKEFALKIEFLLKYLDEFWQKNSGETWKANNNLQEKPHSQLKNC